MRETHGQCRTRNNHRDACMLLLTVRGTTTCVTCRKVKGPFCEIANSYTTKKKQLFNRMLATSFPECLSVGMITAVFKSGEKSDMSNYRGITVYRTSVC